MHQRTFKQSARIAGVGVHSGEAVTLTLHPAPIDTGIIFRRVDLENSPLIPALIDYVGNTDFCTCLSKDNIRIATIEHLLSALSAFGIDNAYADLTLAELPILDGSAKPWVDLIQSAGIEKQTALKKFIRIKKSITVQVGDKKIILEPHHGFRVACEIVYDHPVIKKSQQAIAFDFSLNAYIQDISCARTFGFYKDYDLMREKKLALGASLENTVVVEDHKIMNETGLRYPDEFVKHKILDAIGDLYLLGHNVIGAFSGYKSGHALNSDLIKKLLQHKDAWEIVTFHDASNAPICYTQI